MEDLAVDRSILQALAHDLIDAIESLARARSCFRLEVTTQPQRTDALGFYVALGFQERPRRLVKPLACPKLRSAPRPTLSLTRTW